MLFKKQRNELFSLIVDYNLLPSDFLEENTARSYVLKFSKSPFSLTIAPYEEYYTVSLSPHLSNVSQSSRYPWKSCLAIAERWLSIIKEDDDTPDLWIEAQVNTKLFTPNQVVPDEMFNGAELRQLEAQVRQLVEGLTALGLPAHAQKMLTETIKEMPSKAIRFTKKELAAWFMGAFIAQMTRLALSEEHVKSIGHLIKTMFMGVLQLH
jgi:uncharacterized protein YjeT (DUF2065 family)